MIEAGCIDPEDVPDDHEDVPDDHGNDIDDATVAAVGADVEGALDYDDDIDFFRFPSRTGTESYQIDVALGTLDDSIVDLYDTDGSFLDTNDDYGDTSASRLYWEAPSSGERYVLVGGYGTGTYTLTVSLIVDDHGNSEGDATAIRVGTDVRGAVDYDDDIDFFRFKAERGQSYQIDVALGTLDDSIVDLHDTDWSFLDTNDDYGDTLASRLYWEAPSSGERYVLVGGYGTGTYTLTVSLIVDDHGNSEGDATAIRVGTDVRGAVDYDDDIDFFRFKAERGQSYQIDVALGTLDDSIVDLHDTDWSFLDTNDDYGDTYASRLYWEAPSSGERYVLVGGAYTSSRGTYTLTVSHSTIVDDHGDTAEDGVGVASDRAVLVALYNATEGGSWTTRTNWLSGRPLDEWHGVTTDSDGRVTALNLSSNSLYGALPAALGRLSNLNHLNLADNQLTGEIPPELGGLSNLTELVLSDNQLTGEIPPELGGLSNLNHLNLADNGLTGEIPPELGSLANLEWLYLSGNQLTGEIPPELGGLSNLIWLVLDNNQLTGTIPKELGSLANLTHLWLWSNQLTGEIPSELGGLSNLTELVLRDNQLTGTIPKELGSLANLQELYLGGNLLTGCVPAGLRDVPNNDFVSLGLPFCSEHPCVSGGAVVDATNTGLLSDCGMLLAARDTLAGTASLNWSADTPITEWNGVVLGGTHGHVTELDLGALGLNGRIPKELGSLANLRWLFLGQNQLTGEIPPELGGLSNLTGLWLSSNQLTGEIPPELGRLSNLTQLVLGGNQLTGEIPPELGGLSNLTELVLGGNQLTGEIPPELGGLSNLTRLVLADNQLTGEIPPELGGLSNLAELFLDGNQLTGCVPVGLRDVAEENDLGELELPDCGLEGRPAADSFVSVSAGREHTCGVRSSGSVACWGRDEYGQATPPAGSFVSVNAGVNHTCGVKSNGSVACWGNNDYGGQATPAG